MLLQWANEWFQGPLNCMLDTHFSFFLEGASWKWLYFKPKKFNLTLVLLFSLPLLILVRQIATEEPSNPAAQKFRFLPPLSKTATASSASYMYVAVLYPDWPITRNPYFLSRATLLHSLHHPFQPPLSLKFNCGLNSCLIERDTQVTKKQKENLFAL